MTPLGYNVDIVFCIDVTGSMVPLLEMVRDAALAFHQSLQGIMRDKGKTVTTLRVRVVAFRDFKDDPTDALEETGFFTLPMQLASFQAFLHRLRTGGGGDEPESGLEALAVAIDSPWNQAPGLRRQIIVLFTDAAAHPLGDPKSISSPGYPPMVPLSLEELGDKWMGIHATAPMDNRGKRLILFAPNTSPWSDIAAEWDNTIFYPSRAGEGLSEWEQQELMAVIANSV